MKCISLWQPWASAIAWGLKGIETRGWPTAVRGRIAIHASKRWTREERDFLSERIRRGEWPDEAELPVPLGAIVCTALLVDCVPTSQLLARGVDPLDLTYGNFGPGRYGWILDDVVRLSDPIEWKGKQGFFTVRDDFFTSHQRHQPPPAQAALL